MSEWIELSKEIPEKSEIVWCLRSYNGIEEVRLAKRASDKPITVSKDLSADCYWYGFNRHEGRNWSDATVKAWAFLNPPPKETP